MTISLKNFLARGEIVDGWFRQLERLVRTHAAEGFINIRIVSYRQPLDH